MLDAVRPDVFDIATPPATHYELVQLACDRAIATVVCQKPLAPTLREARAIVELAESRGVKLIVHENFRFQPWFVELRRLLQVERVVGTPYNLSFRLRPGDGQGNPPAYVSRQPYFREMERFIIHETGIHFIDVFRCLFGDVRSVLAELHRLNPCIAGEDAGTVIFAFEEGRRGVLDANRLVDHDAEDTRLTMGEMLIEGSAGVLRLDGRGRLFARRRAPAVEEALPLEWPLRGFAGDCVYAFQSHVAEHLLRGAPLVNDGRAFLENVRIEEAIYTSSAEQRRVALVPTLRAVVVGGAAGVRAQLGEGAIWDASRGHLLYVDINRARVYRYEPQKGVLLESDLSPFTQHVSTVVPLAVREGASAAVERLFAAGGGAAAAAEASSLVGDEGAVLVGTTEGVGLYAFASGRYVAHPANGFLAQHERMNDGKCDPHGRFWVGSVAKTAPDGPSAAPIAGGASLWVYDGWDGSPTKVVAGVTISNGLAWTDGRMADGGAVGAPSSPPSMLYIDSATLDVDAFLYDGERADATPQELVRARRRAIRVDGNGTIPDGCCLDTCGCLWVAVYGAGEVRRYDTTTGALLASVELPTAAGVETTSVAFGGEALDELYITTACKFWSEEKLAALPLGGCLFKVTCDELAAALGPGIRGVPAGRFDPAAFAARRRQSA